MRRTALLAPLVCLILIAPDCGSGWITNHYWLAAIAGDTEQLRHSRSRIERLVRAYPEHLSQFGEGQLIWRDGTAMAVDDGGGAKAHRDWLSGPDIDDMMRYSYAIGRPTGPPEFEHDPGRARPAAFFRKMYGDCRKGEVRGHLKEIVWLPSKSGQRLMVTTVNGVAKRLQKVSLELDRLPARYDAYLIPSAGTYNCRVIAGTKQVSAHGYGIAIDLSTKHAHYWRWSKPDRQGRYRYVNAIPFEIVDIFERHGFIWGGKWYHYDTMHFEYRPELTGTGAGRP